MLLLVLVAGCGSPSSGSPSSGSLSSGSPSSGSAAGASGSDDLVVRVDQGDGSAPVTWTLGCAGAPTGTHPDAAGACTHLLAMEDPFAPIPADAVCTQQYGGPQSARVTGTWRGKPVDLQVTRVDGCRISQWDALVPLLPAVPAAGPPS